LILIRQASVPVSRARAVSIPQSHDRWSHRSGGQIGGRSEGDPIAAGCDKPRRLDFFAAKTRKHEMAKKAIL
jgi:hypothetical protein